MNNTLQNGFRVLEYLASTAEEHSVKELAEIFGLPNSHICRLLKTLADTGYVEQTKPSRKYRVGLKILRLSHACLSKLEIRQRLRPILKRAAAETNSAVYLSVPFERTPVIVDFAEPSESAALDSGTTIGSTNPINCSATGKIYAAYCPGDINDFLENVTFEKLTENTVTDKTLFIKELEIVRKEKSAVAEAEKSLNVSSAASPVFDRDGNLAAIIGAAYSPALHADIRKMIKKKIREAGDNASYALGYALYNTR